VAYASLTPPNVVPSPQSAASLIVPAYLYLGIAGMATLAILLDLLRYSRRRAAALMEGGMVPLSPLSIGPYVLSQRRYSSVFAASAILYGLLYSFLTSIVAYRPDISFAALPGLVIPSVQPDQLVGAPLYVPEVTVFLTDHVALVLIPLTLMLMVTISVLVGFNVALAAFAYDNRARGGGSTWGGQLGAAVGLFTGCPTCAGLYFFSLLGGSGAVSFAVALSYYQPLFVVLSIPVLMGSPYLISRSLSKLFKEGCVAVPPGDHHRP
jgi:hypothetical protein